MPQRRYRWSPGRPAPRPPGPAPARQAPPSPAPLASSRRPLAPGRPPLLRGPRCWKPSPSPNPRGPAAPRPIVISGLDSCHRAPTGQGEGCSCVPPAPSKPPSTQHAAPQGEIPAPQGDVQAHRRLTFIGLPWLAPCSSQDNPLVAAGKDQESGAGLLGRAEGPQPRCPVIPALLYLAKLPGLSAPQCAPV